MRYTKEERLLIGKNIKIVREAWNCFTQEDFYEYLGRPEKLRADTLRKIEEGGYESLKEETVRKIAEISLVPYEAIVHMNNLEDELKPGVLYKMYNNLDEHPLDTLSKSAAVDNTFALLRNGFPLFINNSLSKDDRFVKAVEKCDELTNRRLLDDELVVELHEIEDLFIEYYEDKGYFEACANFVSIVCRFFYLFMISSDPELIKNLRKKDYDVSTHLNVDLLKIKQTKEAMEYNAYKKKILLETYNDKISNYMADLAANPKYKDLAYHYLAMRYLLGIMDSSYTLMDEDEMKKFGRSMIDSLAYLGNEYTLKIKNPKPHIINMD